MTTAPVASPRLVTLPAHGPAALEGPRPVLEYAPVVAHREVGPETWLLTLRAPVVAERVQPGQFAMLTLAREGETAPVLPRPMALYAWDRPAGTMDVVYRVVGEGTRGQRVPRNRAGRRRLPARLLLTPSLGRRCDRRSTRPGYWTMRMLGRRYREAEGHG